MSGHTPWSTIRDARGTNRVGHYMLKDKMYILRGEHAGEVGEISGFYDSGEIGIRFSKSCTLSVSCHHIMKRSDIISVDEFQLLNYLETPEDV